MKDSSFPIENSISKSNFIPNSKPLIPSENEKIITPLKTKLLNSTDRKSDDISENNQVFWPSQTNNDEKSLKNSNISSNSYEILNIDKKSSKMTIHNISLSSSKSFSLNLEDRVHVFYYIWYGNLKFDGKYMHWNHKVLPHWQKNINQQYPSIGKSYEAQLDSIGSNFFPLLGTYSSRSEEVMHEHFRLMKKESGIGVAVVSWWGITTSDENGENVDHFIPSLLRVAEEEDIKIAFHLEPYASRTAKSTRNDLQYILDKYGTSKAFYLHHGKPLFYVYDAYLIKPHDWKYDSFEERE